MGAEKRGERNMLSQTLSMASPDVHVIERIENKPQTIRVGAYCRVSTDMEVQKRSMETQMMAYEQIIDEHPGWTLAGIYADQGLSGTGVNRRTEFLRMIEDAKSGKLDYILVKSVSRFSRNTVDLLRYIRDLREIGVFVYFEKEKIDTRTMNSEFMVSIYAAAAQEESISLSNNMKVGRRMRFAQGVQQWYHVYGYRKGWVIEPEEAAVIRQIFSGYLAGKGIPEVCSDLNVAGVPTSSQVGKWAPRSIALLLHNEIYAGDLRMQKSYVKDTIKHVQINNKNMVVRQFYKKDHHEPIVSHEEFEAANRMLAMRDSHRGMTQYPFYGLLKCPYCGENMIRFHYLKTDYMWTCGGKGDEILRSKRTKCQPYAVQEKFLMKALKKARLPRDYWPLSQIVDKMTFQKNDWFTLRVFMTTGEVKELKVEYDHPGHEPLPVVTEGLYEWNYIKGKETKMTKFVNGHPVKTNYVAAMMERLKKQKDMVLTLPIYPHHPWEPDIPRVRPETPEAKKEYKK